MCRDRPRLARHFPPQCTGTFSTPRTGIHSGAVGRYFLCPSRPLAPVNTIHLPSNSFSQVTQAPRRPTRSMRRSLGCLRYLFTRIPGPLRRPRHFYTTFASLLLHYCGPCDLSTHFLVGECLAWLFFPRRPYSLILLPYWTLETVHLLL